MLAVFDDGAREASGVYEGLSALRSGAMSAACACVYVSCMYVCV